MTKTTIGPVSETDKPSVARYYFGELVRVTRLSLSQTVRLEILGVHPVSSSVHHVWGPSWQRADVDHFAQFLDDNPDYRDWLLSLVDDTPIPVSANLGRPESM